MATSYCSIFPINEIRNQMILNIELNLNTGVNSFGPIRKQGAKIGGSHLAFFSYYFCTGATVVQRVQLTMQPLSALACVWD